MAGEPSKTSSSPSGPDHLHPTGLMQLPVHPSPYPMAPGFPPVFFGPPPPEGMNNHGDGNSPYPMPYPQMMYVYPPPPPPGPGSPLHGSTTPQSNGKPKRKQVKMACTNCAAACKKCDDGRPCQRCIRANLTATCRDGVRKERKKGIKRGPYKRRVKAGSEDDSEGVGHEGPPAHPPQHFQVPEGYFPCFMPPPPAYFHGEGPNGGPPQVPLYPYHQFTPFSYPGGIPIPYPNIIPPPPPPPEVEQNSNGATTKGKKRGRAGEGGSSKVSKKAKVDSADASPKDGDAVDSQSVECPMPSPKTVTSDQP